MVEAEIQPMLLNLIIKFAQSLLNKGYYINLLQVYRHAAAGYLGGFEQIIGQRLQTLRFLLNYIYIFGCFGLVRLVLEQIDIGNDRGQRCTYIVGNIGDQLAFQAFAFHFIGHGCVQAVGYAVDISG